MLPALNFLLLVLALVRAHPHDGLIDEADLNAPMDAALYIHICLQAFVWGLLFPTGMVLGITRCAPTASCNTYNALRRWQVALACPFAVRRDRAHLGRLHPRSQAWRSNVSRVSPRYHSFTPYNALTFPSGDRRVSQVAHP